MIKQEIDKLYDKLKEINPDNNSVVKFKGSYLTDIDVKEAVQKVLDERK